ncbi:SWIM zinc finger family protein [Haloarculaceae archaeon H-GB2-1]|nr:SWIM zinc finger domain-containing protein [Haloarculaceae archaeon H-GB1-1]MEA5409579.1 SWIM zinc finger family protein [Haloarculaceae archaeon H-GB2-1]
MHPIESLSFPTRVAKRAQYEAFAFTYTPDGRAIRVRNESHADPDEHEYRVDIEDGVPTSCTCPADEQFDGACKHRVAVAIRPRILDSLQRARRAQQSLRADGGCLGTNSAAATSPSSDDADECSACIGAFPCWDCYRTGRRELPGP